MREKAKTGDPEALRKQEELLEKKRVADAARAAKKRAVSIARKAGVKTKKQKDTPPSQREEARIEPVLTSPRSSFPASAVERSSSFATTQ